jgi:hypothetical protein
MNVQLGMLPGRPLVVPVATGETALAMAVGAVVGAGSADTTAEAGELATEAALSTLFVLGGGAGLPPHAAAATATPASAERPQAHRWKARFMEETSPVD